MMKDEFKALVKRNVSDDDWEVINFVYSYHPSISETEGKNQVAYLYDTFGKRIFSDMYGTAKKAYEIEEKIQSAKYLVSKYRCELADLRTGAVDRY